jgi:poly(3-hydroxybutyrate) depolymerase
MLVTCAGLALSALPAAAQTEYEYTIETSLGDTETFWLQIPAGYTQSEPCPLLVGWHQLGGDHWEMKNATEFDEIANTRGWIAVSHQGVSATHWNNHPTQAHVVDVIRWIQERYAIDPLRIYMVGASMGGAAGMVFANNHLDPAGPMIAAAASMSGIQDCERRFHEQGTNSSMIAAFGGTPDEVPYEYHRNSAIYFADSTASMHVNARHLPLWLTFGHGDSDQIWREHAEDLYAAMVPIADTVVLRESAYSGHGWGCAEERLICDFLEAFALDPLPAEISINADEEGWWSWAWLQMGQSSGQFARFEARAETAAAHVDVCMICNVARLDLDLPALGFPYGAAFSCRWNAGNDGEAQLGFRGVPGEPGLVLRDGEPFAQWSFDSGTGLLLMTAAGDAGYQIFLDPAAIPEPGLADVAAATARPVAGGLRVPSIVCLHDGVPCFWAADTRADAGPQVRDASWTLFDPAGRGVAHGAHTWSGADERFTLRLPERLATGSYLLRWQSGDRRAAPLVRRLTVLR